MTKEKPSKTTEHRKGMNIEFNPNTDISFGQGDLANKNPANKVFRSLVKKIGEEYDYSKIDRHEKKKIGDFVEDFLEENGYNFVQKKDRLFYKILKQDRSEGSIPRKIIRTKISQTFRDSKTDSSNSRKPHIPLTEDEQNKANELFDKFAEDYSNSIGALPRQKEKTLPHSITISKEQGERGYESSSSTETEGSEVWQNRVNHRSRNGTKKGREI